MEQFESLVRKYDRFVLTTHLNPDGDALGSQLALHALLLASRKTARIVNCDPTPPNYTFLDPANTIETYDPSRHDSPLRDADVIFLVDTNDVRRLRSMEKIVRESRAVKCIIDHHPEPAMTVPARIIDLDAAATGQIVYRLIREIDPSVLTKDIAVALYTAVMTDTGSFRFPKTTPEIHQITSDLIRKGADPPSIYISVYEKGPINRLRLLGEMLAGLRTASGGKIAYAVITRVMFEKTATSEIDTDGFINYTLGIAGVFAGLLFVELPGELKISFRSRGDIPINELAKQFGGNGHKNAAGARLQGISTEDAVRRVVDLAGEFIRNVSEGKKT